MDLIGFGDTVPAPETAAPELLGMLVAEVQASDSYRDWMNLVGGVAAMAARFVQENYPDRPDTAELVAQVVNGGQSAMDAILIAEKG